MQECRTTTSCIWLKLACVSELLVAKTAKRAYYVQYVQKKSLAVMYAVLILANANC